MHLAELSDDELLASLKTLVADGHRIVATVIAYLAEVEERRLHLELACSSMFDFCRRKLGLSEGEAFRRLTASRLVRRFPSLLEAIASGRVHLSSVVLLRDLFSDNNVEALVAAASGKTLEKEKLGGTACSRRMKRDRASEPDQAPGAEEPADTGSYEERSGTSPPVDSAPPASSARVTRAVRRDVVERDGMRCSFVAANGDRCPARAFLEFDHRRPRALGGTGDTSNMRVLCRAHNRDAAERVFGRERIEERIHFSRQQKSLANAATKGSVRGALHALGFRRAETDRALRTLDRAGWSRSVEALVREALLVLTW